jgi:hypothetical protein
VIPARIALAGAALVALGWAGAAAAPRTTPGECTRDGLYCLYRSIVPSAGLVADCRSASDCRVGYYYGAPEHATWFTPPAGTPAFPKPTVTWHTATLAEARFPCGPGCATSYFFEARRRRVSPPRRDVMEVDPTRQLLAAAVARALVVSQIFAGREVARIERPWAPASRLVDVVTGVRFDPDGRLAFTWLRGEERVPVTERVVVPSIPR